MRTTLTLDDDVEALLRKALERRGATLKSVVNEALRRGLVSKDKPAPKPYRTRPVELGQSRIANLDNISEVLAVAEGEFHR